MVEFTSDFLLSNLVIISFWSMQHLLPWFTPMILPSLYWTFKVFISLMSSTSLLRSRATSLMAFPKIHWLWLGGTIVSSCLLKCSVFYILSVVLSLYRKLQFPPLDRFWENAPELTPLVEIAADIILGLIFANLWDEEPEDTNLSLFWVC